MKAGDRKEFSAVLAATMEVFGANLSAEAAGIWWTALERFDVREVRRALSLHIQTSKFAPRPADIIAAMQANDGRPGPEEAWAIVAPSISDERVTIVWTPEMQRAFGAALHLSDDTVAARMAFTEVYKRELSRARADGEPVRWQASLGTDAAGREGPLMDAQRMGRLSASHVAGLLPGVAPESMLKHIQDRHAEQKRLEALVPETVGQA